MRPRVFITQPIAHSAMERLRGVAEIEWNRDALHTMTKGELCAAARDNDILFCLLQDRVDADVIAANPKQVEQYRGGKTTLIGFFVGQVMKASRGQADPAAVNELLKSQLG